jgi:hypothetical protein
LFQRMEILVHSIINQALAQPASIIHLAQGSPE